jgi:competence protein ComEC
VRAFWIAGLIVVGATSGALAAQRTRATLTAPIPEGRATLIARVLEDPLPVSSGYRFLARPIGVVEAGGWVAGAFPNVAVISDEMPRATAGTKVVVSGFLRSRPAMIRGDPVAGRLSADSVEPLPNGQSALFAAGNALRDRVTAGLAGHGDDPAAALMAGFLIGDTTGLDFEHVDALRRSGLTHFVAVSGSNVALFLLAWWVVTAPLSIHPRIRGVVGLAGLALFVVATRWEPSVLRAAAMAGLVLGGRVFSVPIDAWTALGGAGIVLLSISGHLAADIGFQLSAVATAGVMMGSGIFAGRRPKLMWTGLAAAVAAQAAVIPLLLLHFGIVPLLSPLANLVAAPLVTIATTLGGVGVVVGIPGLTGMGIAFARAVLAVAETAADWPQLDWLGTGLAVAGGLAALRTSLRPFVAVAVAGILGFVNLVPVAVTDTATVTFFDVGQGDAVLLQDAAGVSVLIDAGRDPRVIRGKLRDAGVRRIDLLVATHGDADHVAGMIGLESHVAIDRMWVPDQPDLGELLPRVAEAVAARGGKVEAPSPGTTVSAGGFTIEVLSPQRRYQGENDGSVVLWVEAAGTSVLLPGDIEAVAQRELPGLQPDVLLVPHHGSATTDLRWLAATVAGSPDGKIAVVSVGENTYGHPSPEVLAVLEAANAFVVLTTEEGDVAVTLDNLPAGGRSS